MDTIVEGPNDGRGHIQDTNIVDPANWNSQNQGLTNNSTLLYIAVSWTVFSNTHSIPLFSLPTNVNKYIRFHLHSSPKSDPDVFTFEFGKVKATFNPRIFVFYCYVLTMVFASNFSFLFLLPFLSKN